MISISRIKLFKACRRAYELRYVYGLRPVQDAEALQIGHNYHDKIAQLLETGDFDASDLSKESAMAMAYKKYVYPYFKAVSCETWLEKGGFHGRVDAIADDGSVIEHKTTSGDIGEDYEYNLQWDEQVLMYMYLADCRSIWYTVCKKPTIRQKKNESEEEFFQRMVDWYDEDTESKIRYFKVTRTDEEVQEFVAELWRTASEMKNTDFFYKNTSFCHKWGRMCEYASVCLHYDPNQEYIEFTKEEVDK